MQHGNHCEHVLWFHCMWEQVELCVYWISVYQSLLISCACLSKLVSL